MTPERKALLDQIGMHWTLRADESECPAAAIISELLPREKNRRLSLTAGFFYGCIWPSLASARECAWTKVFQNDNIVKNFEKVHWEGACKE